MSVISANWICCFRIDRYFLCSDANRALQNEHPNASSAVPGSHPNVMDSTAEIFSGSKRPSFVLLSLPWIPLFSHHVWHRNHRDQCSVQPSVNSIHRLTAWWCLVHFYQKMPAFHYEERVSFPKDLKGTSQKKEIEVVPPSTPTP